MAATRLIALHINKGKTVAQCLADRTDYSENAAKTEDGKYISAYACDAKTCDEEFLLSKRQYEHITGRTQAHDVIAYQIRQSFKPGEITPEEANKVGYETAMRFTKGKHAFIVATHVDRAHIHNHIIFNSTTLDCTKKFRDFRLSGLALARLSDIVCLEHRLSVIIRKPYGERQKRTEYPEKKSQRDEICEAIDAALARKPKDFRELIGILQEAGYEYKDGKQPALRGKGHARFARFRSLGKGYSVEELCEVIAGNAVHKSKFAEKTRTSARSAQVHQKAELSFLIDVRAKMQAGKGAGYARWAKVFNLKQMAKAMMFMEEHGIKSYAELKEKADVISEKCDALLESVKADEARMSEVSVLRKHLINYAKTKDVFAAYKASGYNREFYEAHRDTLALRSAAKKAFPRRKELLSQIGMDFEVRVRAADEKTQCTEPSKMVQELSRIKARDVFEAFPRKDRGNVLIIGADTIVCLDGRIMGKPQNKEQAEEMLDALQGNTHQVYTGVTLIWQTPARGLSQAVVREHSFYEKTSVSLFPMTVQEIADYVNTGEPLDKAGAYGIQGKFAAYIRGIEGDFYNVVGLPTGRLYQELKKVLPAPGSAGEGRVGGDL